MSANQLSAHVIDLAVQGLREPFSDLTSRMKEISEDGRRKKTAKENGKVQKGRRSETGLRDHFLYPLPGI